MIEDQLGALLDDEAFLEIQKRKSLFNLFEAVGGVYGELKHSNFLAYLLSPNRPHGLGVRPLQLFLRRLLETVPVDQRPISTLEVLVGDLDGAVIYRERDSIDVLIEIDTLNLVVLVENKVRAKAGDGQLRRYRELIEARYPLRRRLLVFLTPDGHLPDDEGYISFSYKILMDALEALAFDLPVGGPTRLIVEHYVDMVRKNIVEDDHLRQLAARLYERHAEALDFIFESRPKPATMLEVIARRIRSLAGVEVDTDGVAMVRFAPARWDRVLSYRSSGGWTKSGRGILFEVKADRAQPGRIFLSLVIGPGDAPYRTAFYAAAHARPDIFTGLNRSMGKVYSTVFSRDLMTSKLAATLTPEQQASNLEIAWSDFQGKKLGELIDAVVAIDAELSASRATLPTDG